MVRGFLFLQSWTDQFWCVDPWFEAEHDSEPPTSFAYSTIFVDLRSKIYIKRLYRGSKLDFKHNHDHVHHRPGIQGPVPISPGPDQQPKLGNLGPFRTRINADLETSGRTCAKKIIKSRTNSDRAVRGSLPRSSFQRLCRPWLIQNI